MKKTQMLYICLMEDGKIVVRKTAPKSDSKMHGWMQVQPTEDNAVNLSRLGLWCAYCKGVEDGN
jgi:hypothetical protein